MMKSLAIRLNSLTFLRGCGIIFLSKGNSPIICAAGVALWEVLMAAQMSREVISSFVGDVLPLSLVGEGVNRDSIIEWSIDGDAALIREFNTGATYSFNNGVLVTLVKPGEATVRARLEGVEYLTRVTAREMRHAAPDAEMNYYFGDMHDHTSMNHKQAEFATHEFGTIEGYLDYINDEYKRNEGRLDFGVISDHAGVTNDRDFFHGFELTRAVGDDEGVIVFAGAESEITYTEHDRLGVLHRLSGEIVTINSAGYSDSHSWEEFHSDMSYSPRAIAIFAHPHVVGFSTNGIWNFNFAKNNTPRMLEMARGFEMGNGADRKENLLHEYGYSAALDAGFRLSPTCGSDSHGSRWGYRIMPGKSVIMAPERSREAFLDAFINNRFYATESGNVRLKYSVNGMSAPADLALADKYDFKISLSYFTDDDSTHPTYLEVISDYGEALYTADIAGKSEIAFTVSSDSARYFYLRLVDGSGRKTWSMPVFTGRAYDKLVEPDINPIDMSAAKAFVSGREEPKLINGDPFDSWCAEDTSAVIDIDLGEAHRVAAIAYYPHIILRGKDKGPEWTTSDETAGLVSRYEIYTSTDGENYSLAKRAKAQTLGSENIIAIAPTEARYVRFKALSTVGSDSRIEKYLGRTVKIANLAVFEEK